MPSIPKHRKLFVEGPIQPSFIADSIASHTTKITIGAHAIFLGQVRADEKNGIPVQGIVYTAYEPMAEQRMADMREAFFEQYPDMTCLHIYHSLGMVKTGEISLFVFVSCRHRQQSFQALEHIVDCLKAELPVWKQEFYADDTYHWV